MGAIYKDGVCYSASGGGGGGASSADQVSLDDTNLAYEADDVQEAFEKVTKSLTYAEYEALTEEEKNNGTIYLITDINGTGDKFQPIIYSEEEREIGVWINGKPLYKRTIVKSFDDRSTTLTISFSDYSVEGIFDYSIMLKASDSTSWVIPGYDTGGNVKITSFNIISCNLSRLNGTAWGNTPTVYLTIYYSKTDDTAGSGQWTPQGVPAHHYSEDEQVVGTWIDGSTIYEKTFDLGSETSISYNSWYNTGLTGFNKICDCFGLNNIGASYPLNASIQSNTLHLWSCRGTEVSIVRYLTLRYTKSST